MKGYVTKSLQFLACLFFLTMNALAANPSSLADGAQLLKGSERIAVLNEIGSIEKEYGVRLAVVTVKTTNNVKIGDYANQLLDSTYKDGKNGSMVLAMDTRDYYLATDTAMRQRISDKGGIPALEEKCLPLLKEKKYADAFKAYALETGELLAYYEANGKAYDPHDAFSWTALLIALILGIGGGFLIRRYLINTMSNVPALAASAYLDENSFDLTEKEDTFLFMNVSRTAKAKKSERHDSTDEKHGGGGGKF